DSAAMREALRLELSDLPVPLAIDFAEDGEQALAAVDQVEYQLIFLDIVMPGIDGYEVCKAIRKIPKYKKTPIVMLSGKTSPLDEVKGIIAGCNTYLTKPIAHAEFQEVIRRVVKWLDSVAR
ncbi:MAG TPA: response regulator, partial [Candidatus Tenderia sp.]|nr:response regulator [Candidatus Tenderia sp.]